MSSLPVADALVPASFGTLLEWALAGLERERTVFGLPKRAFWTGGAGLDLSVAVPGGRVATPLGIAAGPHTQLAHNIVAGWLAGARVLELKTVQVLDRLEIPRPCIDAPGEGYNVEWSQELRLEESLSQYVAAWCLVHTLGPRVLGAEAAASALAGTRFDASVGYDLAGIRSDGVARFLDTLAGAAQPIARLRDTLPAPLRALWPHDVPARIAGTVTLSSFHGCPPEQIEHIVEHLFARHALDVVVKLNPTLLGYEQVDAVLHGPLGWRHVELDRAAFERDLQWDAALELLARLRTTAERHGRTLGVKLTNTLVVRNTRGRLAGEAVYLSGPPLHPIAITLAERLACATGGVLPMALSAGVQAENFAEAVACGFAPVTTCTDLLRPTGYRRLPRYLKALEAELERTGVRSVDGYVSARARERGEAGTDAGAAALGNLSAYAASVRSDARYGAAAHAVPAVVREPLALVDCESCNQCTLVCPNGAFFDVASPEPVGTAAASSAPPGAVPDAAGLGDGSAALAASRERQWVLLADFCNSCGNCDTFCPQSGGPYLVKPRLHTSRAAWERDPNPHAVLVEDGGRRIFTRLEGRELEWLQELVQRAMTEVNPLSARLRPAPSERPTA
jgi:putative selenate reductase